MKIDIKDIMTFYFWITTLNMQLFFPYSNVRFTVWVLFTNKTKSAL